MRKPRIKMSIFKEDIGYSAQATSGNKFIGTQGDTFEELIEMILEAVNLTYEDEGFTYLSDEISLEYDLRSFFNFYKVINPKTLSSRIGMRQDLLTQYIKGSKNPTAAQTKRILNGVRQLGKELSDIPI